ncbi:MAG: NAD(P)H-hydrate dehydratase [Clostridia bacterium]|nr:NAD(P)H-hydrate dehydratase [Clostridia bacterium]
MSIMTKESVFSLIQPRYKYSSKHDYGKLLALCGSAFYRGAAFLSCGGALRCGAGIVTLASTEKVIASVSANAPECTFLPLKESENGTVAAENSRLVIKTAGKYTAMLVGCGLYIDADTRALVKTVIPEVDTQLVIDADGLNILSECPELLKNAKRPPVITPHFGEMARLCGTDRREIEKDPLEFAKKFAEEYNCIVVLKSAVTYIATPDGRIAVNRENGNPGLSRGGSGDVLAGMIASFCAQKMTPFDAAKCGVFLHGYTADKTAERLSVQGMLPSDLLTDLSSVFKD